MRVCAHRTSTSLLVCGTTAARRTDTALLSSMRPWLALGAWASNPFWPMDRRALRAKRGAFATEAAKACRSGGPRAERKPTARRALGQPGARNTVGQPATCRATMRQAPDAVRDRNRNKTMATWCSQPAPPLVS